MTRAPYLAIIINAAWVIIGLIGVFRAQQFYIQTVQVPRCFEYARAKGLPDTEFLEFREVTIASNRSGGHTCHFVDTRDRSSIILEFDSADIPYGIDTLQVLCMIVPMLIAGLVGAVLYFRVLPKESS
jgi:hypothetical protein